MWKTNTKKGEVWKKVYALSSLNSAWFWGILALLNEHPTDDLTYLSSHIPISIAVHDTFSKEPVYLVDKKPGHLIKQFIEVLTEKQEAIAADVLKQHPYPSDFQMLLSEVK